MTDSQLTFRVKSELGGRVAELEPQGEVIRLALRAVRSRRCRVPDTNRAHRLPAGWQPERLRRDVTAEQRAGDPAGAQSLDRQRDEQVLDGGADRDQEHRALGGIPARVWIRVGGV